MVDKQIDKLDQKIIVMKMEVQWNGNVLDLHFLHVCQALCFLKLKGEQMKESGQRNTFVEVVIGYGASGAVLKIKPAVEEYLKTNEDAYTHTNNGVLWSLCPCQSSPQRL
jgi:hypothetical protein